MASRICKFCAGTFQQIFCAAAALVCTRRSSLSELLTTVPRFLLSRCGTLAAGSLSLRLGLVSGPPCGPALALTPLQAPLLAAFALLVYLSNRQATPGSSLPSINSREAPPPVLMWVILSA